MFSCVRGSEVPSESDDAIGGETIDKILAEVTKLKRKCKSLRTILSETETQRKEEKELYDKTLQESKVDYERKLAHLKSQNYIEVTL